MKSKVLLMLAGIMVSMYVHGQFLVSGNVSEISGESLQGATVFIQQLERGTVTDVEGNFSFMDVPAGLYTIKISYIGYESVSTEIRVNEDRILTPIKLTISPYQVEEATVTAIGAGERTPMAYVNLGRDEIRKRNHGQDVPFIIGSTPSLITTSDAGHGIGYTAMRIRGTDANRINVTINGVPLNDAESHSVFWVDLPELASSADQIQIQRGVGTSTNGAAAFGATVNLRTRELKKEPYVDYDFTGGSFNTLRNSVKVGSGLINNQFSIDMRLSDLHSDGYIDRSWTDLQSYYVGANWYGNRTALQFITFGGFEELYQAWGGVPSSMLEADRTFNPMGAYTDTSGQTAYYDNQVDHYDQIHYQLHFSRQLADRLHLDAALHYTRGEGYYEEYEPDQDYGYYSMEYPVVADDTIWSTDLVRRKWLDNDFYGAIASLTYEVGEDVLILGGGWNRYDGLHFGRVIWAAYMGNNASDHQWYEGTGIKTDWNLYTKYYKNLTSDLTGFVDLQLRGINHSIDGTDAQNRDVTQQHSFLFFNPKTGLNFTPASGQRLFASYARASREPNRNNYTDAPPGNTPVHETLNDFEAGYSYAGGKGRAGVTLYYMDYDNQLVLTGAINEVGYPVMTNVKDSYRAGIELEAAYNFQDKITWEGNLSLSQNTIQDFTNYVDNWDYWSDPDNEPYQVAEQIGESTLAYSPSITVFSQLEYAVNEIVKLGLDSRYVGKQYIDNTANPDYMIDPYFVNDLRISLEMNPSFVDRLEATLLVRNLLNMEYETNAWIYRYYSGGEELFLDGYYPQAGRHLMLSLAVSF